MHRIDTEGSNGTFTDGNPAIGQLGTLVDAAYDNDLQETICNPIEHAGIVLVKGDPTQLTQAIVKIAQGVGGGGGGGAGAGAVPTTRRVNSGGLVKGGRALDGDITLTVDDASPAEINAGIRDDAAISPAGLAAAMGDPSGESCTFPNGRIEKDNVVIQPLQPGTYTQAFAAAFPDACRSVHLTAINQTGSDRRDTWMQLTSWDKTGFTYTVQTSSTGGNTTLDGFTWEAKGY